MAGHSKWSNIKHRKARQDNKKGKVWSKCSKAIMAAARSGGGDPDSNLSLRYAIDEAKYENMPKDTIKRAIDKGAGETGGADFQELVYEGYGPGGTAVLIVGLTDNNTRTVGDVRTTFKKKGGSMGNAGTVAFMFQTKGQIIVDANKYDEDTIMEVVLDAGADDVESPEGNDDDKGVWTITTEPADFLICKDAMTAAGIDIMEASIARIPDNTVPVAREEARKIFNLIDALEDLDDVQKVFSNADFGDLDLSDL